MHYHLNPLGGIAGDMFAAAMLDCHPDWQETLSAAIGTSGLSPDLAVRALAHNDGMLSGRRFEVLEPAGDGEKGHREWREIRERLVNCQLDTAVLQRAVAIFELLAEAEAAIHGKPVDSVTFHEVGAWDSIADIVSAAWLIERCGDASWSCAPVPLGRGRIMTAHGQLPLPAPAASLLLRGFPTIDDGVTGERVTPTGAAILKHLEPTFGARTTPSVLLGQGFGFGTKTLPGLSNVLQISVFDPQSPAADVGTIAVCQFEVDDQTPEDLAVALDRLRAAHGVLDVLQAPAFGKKGRLCVHIQVLAQVSELDSVVDQCLTETTTLGVRWQTVSRRSLERAEREHAVAGERVRVKSASRPGGVITRKVEMADLAEAPGGHAGREERRREASTRDMEADDNHLGRPESKP